MRRRLGIQLIIVFMLILVGCKTTEDDNYLKLVKKSMDLPKRYSVKVAIKNGDVVDVHGDITNIEKLDKFIEDVNGGDKAFVRTVRYTIEGDPIIYTLYYNGSHIQCYKDNSRDEYGGSKGIIESNYTRIVIEETEFEDMIIRNYYVKNEDGTEFDSVLAQEIGIDSD